jgi:aspartate/methionine/tyrosine aminotransferase
MSKSYSLAGLRTGWLAGPPEAVARCLEVRDYTTISCGVLDDILATVTLEHRDAILERNLAIVRGNLTIVDEWVAREERLSYVRPRAGTTALVKYDYPVSSVDLCQRLFDFNGAFVVPGSAFGEEHAFRLGYACARDVLRGGLDAVSSYLRTLEG